MSTSDRLQDQVEELKEQVTRLQEENAVLVHDRDATRRWVNDLQAGQYVNCVYCGYQYGPVDTTPDAPSALLQAHVEQCPAHPMAQLKAELMALRDGCEALIKEYESIDTQLLRDLLDSSLESRP